MSGAPPRGPDAMVAVVDLGERLPTPEEVQLLTFFDTAEAKSLEALEAAARQIITLVTGLLGLVFGVLALNQADLPGELAGPLVVALALLTLLGLAAALFAALAVVIPQRHDLRAGSLDDRRLLYGRLLASKSNRLYAATVAFGSGMFMFLALVFILVAARF